jgi:O-antigen/teichoic acid export membrane protein
VAASAQGARSLSRLLFFGGATLGLAVGLERMFGFLSAMLAARIGGPQTFGAYSVVLATAGTIAVYAGAGIGTTANRFSGQYRRENPGYRGFVRALILISVLSAVLAATLMFLGARPLAHWMLGNDGLTSFLRLASLSSAAIVLLECCRGLLIGQQRFYSLLVLSIISGVGLVVVLPLAARVSPGAMVAGQGSIALLTVLSCVALSRQLGIAPARSAAVDPGPGLRPVFMFGVVQFSAVAGISVASWWIASLVARSDSSLTQMGMYAVANQFRGLAVIAPGLFAQVGYSLLTNESGSVYGGPNQVMLTNTFLTTSLGIIIGGTAMVLVPWLLWFAYGRSFMAGEIPIVILLATGIIHMSGAPAAHRLSIVGLRAVGVINGVWAALIVLLGIWLVPRAGATGAALAFLIAHAATHLLVVLTLARRDELSAGYLTLFFAGVGGAVLLGWLGYWRALAPSHNLALTVSLLALWVFLLIALWRIGMTIGCMPLRLTQRFQSRSALN